MELIEVSELSSCRYYLLTRRRLRSYISSYTSMYRKTAYRWCMYYLT